VATLTANDHQLEEISNEPPDFEAQNTVPFPTPQEVPDPTPSEPAGTNPDEEPHIGRGQHVQKRPEGAYSRMQKALPPLEANVAYLGDPDDDDIFTRLPPDFASVGAMGTEPT
jgi:hypothetical protein